MNRDRPVRSLKECVNPEYLRAWGGRVSVGEAITFAVEKIVEQAFRRSWRYGRAVNIIFPNFNGKRSIVQHMYFTMKEKLGKSECEIILGDEKEMPGDILIQLVPFSNVRPRHSIPVSWKDNLNDWTWQNVIDHEQYYSTSSSDIWPPIEYLKYANPLSGHPDL